MSKVFLLGYKPPQLAGNVKIEAAHYRTWQFLEPLLDDGNEVYFVSQAANAQEASAPETVELFGGKLLHHSIPMRHEAGWVRQVQNAHDSFQPDCVVAVNYDCALSATKLRTDKPIWMDIYGDYLTIMQVARFRAGSDRGINTSVALMKHVLRKGDVFSVCGTPQQHIMTGELAMAGRLNSRSFGYQFARVVLPGALPANALPDRQVKPHLHRLGVPEKSFIVLWCGGYNTWTDVDTLFAGLEWAMARADHVHYVSVGANTYQASDNVYDRLLHMIKNSAFQERFHMLGWRPWTEVADYYSESDVGINIDGLHYETIYGTRTRLVEMLAAGLPVITSLGCELSDLIGQNRAGLAFESGDWHSLGRHIVTFAQDEEMHSTTARRALAYAGTDLSFGVTTAPVREWVKNPVPAPDKSIANMTNRLRNVEFYARSVVRQIVWQGAGLER